MGARAVVRGAVRCTHVVVNQLVMVPTYMLWMVLLRPLLWGPPALADLYWRLEGVLYAGMTYIFACWPWLAGYTVVEVGDDLTECLQDKGVIMFNHQSAYDVPVLTGIISESGRSSLSHHYMWILHNMFRYTHFGLSSRIRGDFLIETGRKVRDLQPVLLEQHMDRLFHPKQQRWVLVFPEGGFLWKQREAGKEFGRKYGFPILEHVTLPRIGAMKAILRSFSKNSAAANNHRQRKPVWVVDATIAYPGGDPIDLPHMMFAHRPPCHTIVHYKKHRLQDLPIEDETELTSWMYAQYELKDKMLAEYYRTGKFPVDSSTGSAGPRHLQVDMWWAWTLQAISLASFICHYYMIKYAITSITSIISMCF